MPRAGAAQLEDAARTSLGRYWAQVGRIVCFHTCTMFAVRCAADILAFDGYNIGCDVAGGACSAGYFHLRVILLYFRDRLLSMWGMAALCLLQAAWLHLCYVRLGCVRRASASLVAPRDGCRPVLVWLPTAVVLRHRSRPLCRCQVALLPPCGVASVCWHGSRQHPGHHRLVVAWWVGLPTQWLALAVGLWAWVAWVSLCAVEPCCVCQCSALSLGFCTRVPLRHVPLVRCMAHLFLSLGWIALIRCRGHCRSAIALPVGRVACVWSLAGLCGAVLLLADPLYPVAYVGALLWTVPC